jgi:glycosyltransferase involved in cell wall biosynthesis
VLSILMPVFNEAATVERAIDDALSVDLPLPVELIVVDDGSTDGTAAILASRQWPDAVTIVTHPHNRGKGAAVHTALDHARGEYAAILDADLEYQAGDFERLLPPLLDGRTNVVFGIRAFDGYTSHSFLYVLGNRTLTLTYNALFNVYLKDIFSCHKVLRTPLLRELGLREPGFAIDCEIASRLVQRRERIFEIPIEYRARTTAEGKKLTSIDGLRVLRTLVRCRFTKPR